MAEDIYNEVGRLLVFEMCEKGENQSILEDMLDNPEADAASAEAAIKRAINRGLSEEIAIRLYGLTNRNVNDSTYR